MSDPYELNDAGLRDRAVRAARGQARFDVLLTGGRVAFNHPSLVEAQAKGPVEVLIIDRAERATEN